MGQIAPPTPKLDDPRDALSDREALYEVVDGQVVELPPMGFLATLIANRISWAMGRFLETRVIGTAVCEAIFVLTIAGRIIKRRPDVAFVSADRWPVDREFPEEGDLESVPDLAVEVISPHDLDKDVQAKLVEYFEAGVRQVWHVRPSTRHISIYTSPTEVRILGAADTLDGGDLLPGFRMEVGPLFRRTIA